MSPHKNISLLFLLKKLLNEIISPAMVSSRSQCQTGTRGCSLEPNRFALLVDLSMALLAQCQETLPDPAMLAVADQLVAVVL